MQSSIQAAITPLACALVANVTLDRSPYTCDPRDIKTVPGHRVGDILAGWRASGLRTGEPNVSSPGRKGPGHCAQNAGQASLDLTAAKVSGPCESAPPSAMSREACMTEPVVTDRIDGSARARNGIPQGPDDPPIVLVAAFRLCSSGHAGAR